MIHDFHFKLEINILEKLKKIINIKSTSGLIKFIIKATYKFIEKSHYFEKEKDSRYKNINTSKSFHVYLDEEDYRRLKQMHQDLNYYSIAQILRRIINRFLFYYEKYGMKDLLKKINIVNNLISKKLTKEIYKKNKQLYYKEYFSVTYSEEFSPIAFKLLYIT